MKRRASGAMASSLEQHPAGPGSARRADEPLQVAVGVAVPVVVGGAAVQAEAAQLPADGSAQEWIHAVDEVEAGYEPERKGDIMRRRVAWVARAAGTFA
jgi:hypothetical protein